MVDLFPPLFFKRFSDRKRFATQTAVWPTTAGIVPDRRPAVAFWTGLPCRLTFRPFVLSAFELSENPLTAKFETLPVERWREVIELTSINQLENCFEETRRLHEFYAVLPDNLFFSKSQKNVHEKWFQYLAYSVMPTHVCEHFKNQTIVQIQVTWFGSIGFDQNYFKRLAIPNFLLSIFLK